MKDVRRLILYHGTSEEAKQIILKEGFKTTSGEFGTCLYLAVDDRVAYDYGDEIIEVSLDDKYIYSIDRANFKDWIDVEYMAQRNKNVAVCVTYNSMGSNTIDYAEVCVYDLRFLEINR